MNAAAWRAIVFDLDDTLYPERDYVLSGFRAVAAWAEGELGLPADATYSELVHIFNQGVRGVVFDHWLAAHHFQAEGYLAAMVRVYREHTPYLVPYPGVVELLRGLGARCRLGLLSDGYLAVQQRKLAALGLSAFFHVVVFSDELGAAAWKPSVQPFVEILARLGVEAREAVYVADNPRKDFLGAKQVGMATVRLRHDRGLYSTLEPPSAAYAPDLEVTTIADLARVLSERRGG